RRRAAAGRAARPRAVTGRERTGLEVADHDARSVGRAVELNQEARHVDGGGHRLAEAEHHRVVAPEARLGGLQLCDLLLGLVARGLRLRELLAHILGLDALGREQEEPVARHEEQRQDDRDDPAIAVGDHAPPPSDLGTPVEDVPAVGLKLTVASHLDAGLPWIVPQSEVLVPPVEPAVPASCRVISLSWTFCAPASSRRRTSVTATAACDGAQPTRSARGAPGLAAPCGPAGAPAAEAAG